MTHNIERYGWIGIKDFGAIDTGEYVTYDDYLRDVDSLVEKLRTITDEMAHIKSTILAIRRLTDDFI